MTTVDRPTATGWTANDSTFGARLALIRQRMGWGNVKEAAVACGLPVESWRSWERDGRSPQRMIEIATLISTRTGCNKTWLVMGPQDGVGEPNVRSRPGGPSGLRTGAAGHRINPGGTGHLVGAVSPFSPQRHDAARPDSSVSPNLRRPSLLRPGVQRTPLR